LYVIVIILYIE